MPDEVIAGFRLSAQQKHVWAVQPGNPSNVVVLVRLDGPVRCDKLREALRYVVARHEILRTVFVRPAGMKIPFQVVLESNDPVWETVTLDGFARPTGLDELLSREQKRGLDLEKGPTVRACLAELGPERFALILTLAGLCGDSRTLQTIVHELGAIYAGRQDELSAEPLGYVQYADWQSALLETGDEAAREGKEYWDRLNASRSPHLVLPERTSATEEFRPDTISVPLESPLVRRIEAVAASYEAPVASLLIAVWESLLWRLSRQTHFATGVFFEGRQHEELQDALGLFGRTIPLEARFEGDLHFREVLERVRDSLRQTEEWQDYFVPEEHAISPVGFDYVEYLGDQVYGEVKFGVLQQVADGEQFNLKLSALERGTDLTLEFHYNSALLARETVERWSGHFRTLLLAALENPDQVVSRLPMLNERERRQLLLEWNQTRAAYPDNLCLQELFEAQAARTPDRVAVRCGDRQLSYSELNRQANQLAHYLRQLGVGPDALVGLCLERSVEMLVGLLAIVKAGGAYVPLSADHPRARLAAQLSGVVALLTERMLATRMPEFSGPTILLDSDRMRWSKESDSNPETRTQPDNLVYVIYTSGSTGIPKGVAVRHRNLVNYAHFITRRLELERYPGGLQFATVSTLSADLGNTCIYPALISGGCVHLIQADTAGDSLDLGRYMREFAVDVLKIVPSHLSALLEAGGGSDVLPRKYLVLGGETLTRSLMERIVALGADCEVLNHYGPTETTVGSLTLRLSEYDWRRSAAQSISIGRPIANTRVYILDMHRQPVPIGVAGEIYVAGEGVTAGYLGQAEKTAERFLRDPYAEGQMYRTGDLGRYLADGCVEFLGRADEQVKIRGFRIEPGEIEAALLAHESVRQAVVLAREEAGGEKRLVAYVVSRAERHVGPEELHRYLRERLPDYMIPRAIVAMPALPLNGNGKLDRRALPSPEEAESQRRAYEPPRTPAEEALAAIWADVLKRERVGRDDNFFEIGGHSLLATQIVSRIREHFQADLAVRLLFERPTIGSLAASIETMPEDGTRTQEPEIVAVSREAYRVRPLRAAAPAARAEKYVSEADRQETTSAAAMPAELTHGSRDGFEFRFEGVNETDADRFTQA